MQYCKKCVQPDTRPGIKFNEDGICPACLYAEKLNEVDWNLRRKELIDIFENKLHGDCPGNIPFLFISITDYFTAADNLDQEYEVPEI